jgi:transcriptional regulator with XRE-family HTH domain
MKDLNIGKIITDIRKKKKMNLKDLSLATGTTSSMLSQIERGLANPSINTLKTIAQVLDVPLFTFFMEEEQQARLIVRAEERRKIVLPSEGKEPITYELLSPDLKGDIEFAIMTLTPKSHTSMDNFKHIGEEVAYVTKGKVVLYLEEKEVVLFSGDSVRIPPNMLHRWTNPYDKDAEVLWAVTPPSF